MKNCRVVCMAVFYIAILIALSSHKWYNILSEIMLFTVVTTDLLNF